MVFLLTFFRMVSMVLVLCEVAAILGNGYRIQGQNYVALLQGNEMAAGFHFRNLILGITQSSLMDSSTGFASSGPRSFSGKGRKNIKSSYFLTLLYSRKFHVLNANVFFLK